jgi:hypothetical protein
MSVARLARALRLAIPACLTVWLMLCLTLASVARADDAEPASAADVPVTPHGQTLALPPLPASYEVQQLGWWTLEYPASVRDRVAPLVDKAKDWRAQLVADFGTDVLARPLEVRVARTWEDMATLVPKELGVLPYAVGEAYAPTVRLVTLSLTEPVGGEPTDLETVFRHELSHIALSDAIGQHHVPLWFNEGLAIYESGEHPVRRMKELWDATLFRQLLPLAELDRGFPQHQGQVNIAYAESADVVRFLLRGKDRVRFVSLIDRVAGGEPFDRALGDAYDTDVRKLEYQWREECARRNTFAPMLASGSFVWVLAFGALVLGYRRRKRDGEATLARWEKEEQTEAAQRTAVAGVEEDAAFTDPSRVPAGLPKIEHDGGWHTLH